MALSLQLKKSAFIGGGTTFTSPQPLGRQPRRSQQPYLPRTAHTKALRKLAITVNDSRSKDTRMMQAAFQLSPSRGFEF